MDAIIKKYVDVKYPNRVENYHNELKEAKKEKIKAVSNITFIHDNLMWQDTNVNVELKLNRLELKVYCRKLNFANRKDWRVPSFAEMIALVDYSTVTPASIDKVKYIIPLKYWTSSKSVLEKKKNWTVDFDYGTSDISSDLERYNIRCVRDVSQSEGKY